MSTLPGTRRPYQDHLRYKHMVARLQGLHAYALETEVLRELAGGKRWRIDAALEALAGNDKRYRNRMDIFEAAGRYGRLTAMHRLTAIYQSKKIDRTVDDISACDHGILEAFDAALASGHYRVARYLMQFGALHGYWTGNKSAPRAMYVAFDEGNEKKIDVILSMSTKGMASYYLSTAIHRGETRLVEKLLDAGADVNDKVDNHWTALHLAARADDHAMVDLLLARGARVEDCAKDFLYDLIDKTDMLKRMLDLGVQPRERDIEAAIHSNAKEAEELLRAHMPSIVTSTPKVTPPPP